MASSTDSIKLLPWCVSSAVPYSLYEQSIGYCHTTGWKHPIYCCSTQTRGNTGSGSLEQSSLSNLNSSSSNTSLTRHPLCRHSLSGVHPFPGVYCQPHPKEVETTLPAVHLAIIAGQEDPHCLPRGWGLGVNTAPLRVAQTHSELVLEAGPCFEQWGQEPAQSSLQSD